MEGTEETTQGLSLNDELSAAFDSVDTGADDVEGEYTEPTTEASAEAPAEEAPEPINAPHSWAPDTKEIWETLPREVQEIISTRESEREKGLNERFQEVADREKYYSGIDNALSPHREWMDLQGLDPANFLRSSIAWHKYLMDNPQAALPQFASEYGIDLAQLSNQQQTQPVDPAIASLGSKIDQLENMLLQQHTTAQANRVTSLESEISAFQAEKDENGNSLRPHFDAVQDDMIPLVRALRERSPDLSHREVLNQAYERAIWANPEVRKELHASEEAKRIEAAKEKAAKAQKAASSVTGAPGGNGVPATDSSKSVRDALVAAWKENS